MKLGRERTRQGCFRHRGSLGFDLATIRRVAWPAASSSHEHRGPGISGILPIKIDEREKAKGRRRGGGPIGGPPEALSMLNGTRRNVLGRGSFAN